MKVNLGCGKDYREGYINLDFSDIASDESPIKVDLAHDMRKGLPWEDNSVEEVVFRETLEHLQKDDGFDVLKEIYRVLKPEGILDLSVPNAVRQLKMLLMYASRPVTIEQFLDPHKPDWGYWKFHEDLMGSTHRTMVDGKDLGQGDSHKTLFTKNSLECLLKHVGFKISSFKEDSSFYVIAKK